MYVKFSLFPCNNITHEARWPLHMPEDLCLQIVSVEGMVSTGAEPQMLLSYAGFKVALRCSEKFSAFFPQHLQSGGHSEALGRGSSSSRMGRCGAPRTGPRGLRSLTGARAIGGLANQRCPRPARLLLVS